MSGAKIIRGMQEAVVIAPYIARIAELEAELVGWKRVAVEAAIPLEALAASGSARLHCPEVQEGIHHALILIRRAVMGEGLPPAPPPVPSSTKT